MEKNYIKEGKYSSRNGNLMEPGNGNVIKMIEKDIELNRQNGGKTGEPQGNKMRRKYRKYGLRNKEKYNAKIYGS